MEGLIPLTSPKVYPMVSLGSLSAFKNLSSWSSIRSDAIITGKVSLGPKKTYLRESGKGFNSNAGSGVCAKEGGSKEQGERESISSQISFSSKLSVHESSQEYTLSQLTVSHSSKIAGYLCRLKIFNVTVMFLKDNFSIQFLQLIKALEIARKSRPRMTGIWVSELATYLVSRTKKST